MGELETHTPAVVYQGRDIGKVVWERLRPELEKYLGRILDGNTRAAIGATINQVLKQAENEAKMPPEYVICQLMDNFNEIRVHIARNFAKYPADAEEFERLVGRPPVQDDLHRLNCSEAGTLGHMHCGWCLPHARPRFICGCIDHILQE